MERAIQAMALTLKEPWMLVLHNMCAVHATSDLEVACTSSGASNTQSCQCAQLLALKVVHNFLNLKIFTKIIIMCISFTTLTTCSTCTGT